MEIAVHCDGCHTRAGTMRVAGTVRFFCSVECAERNYMPFKSWKTWSRRFSQRKKSLKVSPRTKERVLWLLNHYKSLEKTRRAVALLSDYYYLKHTPQVEVFMCEDFVPGKTDGETIYLCDRTRTKAFQSTRAPNVDYDPTAVTHYAIVVLHEFAHILQPGWSEGRIDEWVRDFVST